MSGNQIVKTMIGAALIKKRRKSRASRHARRDLRRCIQGDQLVRAAHPTIGRTITKSILIALVVFHLSNGRVARRSQPQGQFEPTGSRALVAGSAIQTPPNGTSNKPLWYRPGCYQVGHTRTISIPGCVKFNLSTNACRGFCMSFSIPAAEDIGPPAMDPLEGLAEVSAASASNQLASDFSAPLSSSSSSSNDRANSGLSFMKRRLGLSQSGEPLASNQLGAATSSSSSSSAPPPPPPIVAGLASLSGLSGNIGDKRDVISVGQCCNMMETEDVTVNLRCGFNETRRLVFKSAKTCECFFCKHV